MSVSEEPAASVRQQVARLGPWFHNLHLPGGVQTAPDHIYGDFPAFKWRQIEQELPRDLSGWTALDIGCNAGFYSFELARRGADVLGVDVDPHYLAQARWASEILDLGHKTRFEQRQIYELARHGDHYDLVLFMGVLYHLRYPLLGLEIACRKTRRLLLVQTLTMPGDEVADVPEEMAITARSRFNEPGWPRMAFIEHSLQNDWTNWWAPNHACVLAMLRSCGMTLIAQPGHEMYLCRPDSSAAVRQRMAMLEEEFRTATGCPCRVE